MDLKHQFTVPTGVEETWAHFNDIASVAECFPGATVTSAEGDTFQGSCKVKLGPIAMVYNGSGTFVEKDETSHRFVVEAKGKDKRGNGTAGATVTLSMADSGGSTDVEVLTDLQVTGKPAQFGRGVMQDVSDKLLGQFVACLETRLAGGGADPSGESSDATGVAADQDSGPASMPTGAAAVAAPAGDPDGGPASAPAPPRPPASAPAPPRPPASGGSDSIDLGATVLPVIVKSYWKQGAVGLALVALIIWLVGRR